MKRTIPWLASAFGLALLTGSAVVHAQAQTTTQDAQPAPQKTQTPPARSAHETRQLDAATQKREKILADLYARYGGSETARDLRKENEQRGTTPSDTARNIGRDVSQGVGNVVADIDRATFDAQCRRVGHGQKPILANDRQNAFFAEPDVVRSCEDVSRLDLKIDQLNRTP